MLLSNCRLCSFKQHGVVEANRLLRRSSCFTWHFWLSVHSHVLMTKILQFTQKIWDQVEIPKRSSGCYMEVS